MAYIIYTDRKNLLKSIRSEMIRIPRNLENICNLTSLEENDTIYFYDFENFKIYGPAKAGSFPVVEEKNPKTGPFNGFGRVERHYHYKSRKIDCSSIFKKGVLVKEIGIDLGEVLFSISPTIEENILHKIEHANRVDIPLVLNLSLSGNTIKSTVVEMDRGTSVRNFTFSFKNSILYILDRKKKSAETCLMNGRKEDFLQTVREIGRLIFDHILKKMGFDRVFDKGGYILDITGDNSIDEIPIEIAYRDKFLFENNIIAYRGDVDENPGPSFINNVLILADPSHNYRGACNEGKSLFNYFTGRGIAVDLVSRGMGKDLLTEYFNHYNIVHFSGHCEEKDQVTGWKIGKALFSVDDIIVDEGLPNLIFSSACGNSLKLGIDFLKAGVRNVICSRWKIPDGDYSEFILNFYTLLLDAMEIGYAFNKALIHSYKRGDIIPLSFVFLGESRMVYEKHSTKSSDKES